MKFSQAQQMAVYARNNALLVSAAAGSGKTAVLVERVIQKLLAGGDISRLMIVTFTNAAAAEMRRKIETALEERLSEQPQNEHIAEQLMRLPSAQISTVHAACKIILEQNFEAADIDPGAVIGDEAALDILFEDILEDFTDELFENAREDETLKAFVDFFAGGRSDDKLRGVLKSGYDYLNSQPFPELCDAVPIQNIFDRLPQDCLYRYIHSVLEQAAEQYRFILAQVPAELAESKLGMGLQAETDMVRSALQLLEKRDFDALRRHLTEYRFFTWNTRGKIYEPFAELTQHLKTQRAEAKDALTGLTSDVFYQEEAAHLADARLSAQQISTLLSLAEQLRGRFRTAKKQRGVLSFDDLEHGALRVLIERYNPKTDTFVPTEAALELRQNFDEIIVDEYQDTNQKQDLIFRALSRSEENIFMVGDMKQSIYRFRGACPELFAEKRARSHKAEQTELTEPSYLYLNQNFRSHPDILAFANQVFSQAMSPALGQVCYDDNEALHTGGLYPADSAGYVELDVLIREDDELSNMQAEADFVADKIAALYGTPFYDVKAGAVRSLTYSDMAILCRTATGVADFFEQALARRGIGCLNNNPDKQFLDLWEIKMLRAFLQVLDNPYRDIPLITVMYSDFYGFLPSQLAAVRRAAKNMPFYDAVRRAAETDEKCAAMLSQIEKLRARTAGKRTYEVLEDVFSETYILEKIARTPGGAARVDNMRLLLRYATEYEKNSYKGLFAFLNYLDRAGATGQILPGAGGGGQTDRVSLLSVHKSKGLEWPVCFLVGAGNVRRKNEGQKSPFISDRTLGCAVKMRRDEDFYEYGELGYTLIANSGWDAELSEEMRVLYVALTRPKTHLFITACGDRAAMEKSMEAYDYRGEHAAAFLKKSPSFLKWMLYALKDQQALQPLVSAFERGTAGNGTLPFTCQVQTVGRNTSTAASISAQAPSVDLEAAAALCRQKYAFQTQTELPIKLSVSEVKAMRENDPQALPLIEKRLSRRTPAFISGRPDGNVRGSALHKFMQFADFSLLAAPGGIDREADRLEREAFLSKEEIALVERQKVLHFVQQPIFKDMISADVLEKEKRFFFSLPARELFDVADSAPILLQGVLDCYYEKNGRLYIVDYKTDRLKSEAEFSERYGVQLRLYRRCLRQILGKEADKLYIYSFELDKVIEIS